jgi:hypothetical protein
MLMVGKEDEAMSGERIEDSWIEELELEKKG